MKLLKVTEHLHKDHATNEDVSRKLKQPLENTELLAMVKKKKLNVVRPHLKVFWLREGILQGTVKGKTRRGTQKKRWEDMLQYFRVHTDAWDGL